MSNSVVGPLSREDSGIAEILKSHMDQAPEDG